MQLSLPALCGALLAVLSSPLLASPTLLTTDVLDTVTAAGSNPAPNGGAIIGNGSTATLQSSGQVIINSGSQTDVRALNFVNSSESTVANGVNVFDGSELSSTQRNVDISQSNLVTQDQRRLSSLPSYERGANTETLITDAGSSAGSSSSSIVDQVTNLEQTTTTESATTQGDFSLSDSPTFKLELNGDLEIGSGDPVFDADGSYTVEFNAPSASKSVGVVFNGAVDFNADAGDVTVDTGDSGVLVEVNLPELDLNIDAMGCVALNGSCSIDGTRTSVEENITDLSTLYTRDETSSSETTWDRVESEVVNAPFTLEDAQAEYIVVDDSSIDVNAAYLVSLSGGAQSGLRAMNVVNASGSAVANGVNIATSRGAASAVFDGAQYSLNQSNVINHSR